MSAKFVRTEIGKYLVQVDDPDSTHGFYLCDDDQSWDGGLGIATSWKIVSEEDVPAAVKEKLGWILEEDDISDYGQSKCCSEGRMRYRGGSAYFCDWCGKEEIRPAADFVPFDMGRRPFA